MTAFKLQSFLNFLGRNKLYTSINIFGFGVSLMFVILLSLYISGEMSVDNFHAKGDRIFRAANDTHATFSPPIADRLKERYPEIESTVRLRGYNFVVYNTHDKINSVGLFADSTFFSVFSFPMHEGRREDVIRTRQDVAISREFANKLFGKSEGVLGYEITLDNRKYIVSGVYEEFKNTHFVSPDVIMRFEEIEKYWGTGILDNMGNCSFNIYILTRPNADLTARTDDITAYFKEFFWLYQRGYCKEFKLDPIREVLFEDGDQYSRHTDKKFLAILGVTALMILIFAMINYINLSVAQTGFRAKEAATRRLLGSTKLQLFVSFIIESVLLCFVAFVVGLMLAWAVEPTFNSILEARVDVAGSFSAGNIGLAAAMVVVLGLLSGVAPAYVITRFQPIEVVRGTFKRKTKMVYSKILIGFQYFITIILLGCTITVIRQTNYMMNADLGFDKSNIILMDNHLSSAKSEGLRSVLMNIAGVEAVCYTQGTPADAGNNQSFAINDRNYSFQIFTADSLFIDMLGIEIISRTGNDADSGVWLNESAYRELEMKSGDTEFRYYEQGLAVKGVVRDFNFRGLSEAIGGCMIMPLRGDNPWNYMIKVSGDNQFEVFDKVKAAYAEYNGGFPFEGGFLDQRINDKYVAQKRTSQIIGCLSVLAIIISSLGILAMATYFMRQRAMEVAVRKVFGSSNREILSRLVSGFLGMVIVAFVVSVPVIWYIMSDWLSEYAYRISLSWTIFAAAGLITLFVAMITVLWQSLKATHANPIKTMRGN